MADIAHDSPSDTGISEKQPFDLFHQPALKSPVPTESVPEHILAKIATHQHPEEDGPLTQIHKENMRYARLGHTNHFKRPVLPALTRHAQAILDAAPNEVAAAPEAPAVNLDLFGNEMSAVGPKKPNYRNLIKAHIPEANANYFPTR